jgi:serine/threonine protein kinase
LSEARTSSALNHPNICTLYEIDKFAGQRFIAMELLEGVNLRNRIAASPMGLEELLDFAIEIADARYYIVTRYITPTRGAAATDEICCANYETKPLSALFTTPRHRAAHADATAGPGTPSEKIVDKDNHLRMP